MEVRHQIAVQYAKGEKLLAISEQYHLSYSTVRGICKRYREEGAPGLLPHYSNCGRSLAQGFGPVVHRAALWLKRRHRQWGASLILLVLRERYRRAALPCQRTLQRWFHTAGFYKTRSAFPLPTHPWARRVHDVWQIDANEKLHLGSGQRVCYLTIVDEKSGSLLNAFVFPPFSYR